MTHVPNLPAPTIVGYLLAAEGICADCLRTEDVIEEPIFENAPDEWECERCGNHFAIAADYDDLGPSYAHPYASTPLPGQSPED